MYIVSLDCQGHLRSFSTLVWKSFDRRVILWRYFYLLCNANHNAHRPHTGDTSWHQGPRTSCYLDCVCRTNATTWESVVHRCRHPFIKCLFSETLEGIPRTMYPDQFLWFWKFLGFTILHDLFTFLRHNPMGRKFQNAASVTFLVLFQPNF